MSGLPKKRCSKANDNSNAAEETVKGGACRKNRLRSLSDREGFSLKHLALEERRKRLVESLGLKKDEYAALLAENTAEAKAKAEKIIKKAAFELKYGYVYGGHVKNEILGMLTVYNLGRSFSVRARRKIRFDPTDDKLYLNTYQYLRRDSSKKAKVFVYIHGGGWIGGWPESREAFTTRVASAGFFVVSVYYGEAPKYSHPKMIENIYKALGYVRDHADEWNVDVGSVFVGGESAGAHLAAMAGCISSNPEYKMHFNLDPRAKDIPIAGLVLNCGVYDMEKALLTGFRNCGIYTQAYCGGVKVEETSEEMRREISPIYWLTPSFPPSFVISAENDKLAVLSFDLVGRLYELGVYTEHYHGEGALAVHAFAVTQCLKISREAMDGVRKFLYAFTDIPPDGLKRLRKEFDIGNRNNK